MRVGEATARDGFEGAQEPAPVVHLAVVEAEDLLVEVAEKVERLDADIGALEAALQEAPEVLDAVGVGVPPDVLGRVVDDAVDVLLLEAVVGRECVGVDAGARLDGGADLRMKVSSTSTSPDKRKSPDCIARRMRWSMNHAVFWVTLIARASS